jgi:hypothetical protein
LREFAVHTAQYPSKESAANIGVVVSVLVAGGVVVGGGTLLAMDVSAVGLCCTSETTKVTDGGPALLPLTLSIYHETEN